MHREQNQHWYFIIALNGIPLICTSYFSQGGTSAIEFLHLEICLKKVN